MFSVRIRASVHPCMHEKFRKSVLYICVVPSCIYSCDGTYNCGVYTFHRLKKGVGAGFSIFNLQLKQYQF